MPTFITIEIFCCGHILETRHKPSGSHTSTITESIPLPGRCLACVCHSLLDSLLDGLSAIPQSYMRELVGHYRALTQHPSAVGSRQLEDLMTRALRPNNTVEFRHAITALAGFPELSARFCV
ncbi:hypothetical protein F5X99DRAFT_428917 [Biscogniauxia marginata]|nr:hypothetical protein F5X99DRAFT_428917 [Biscogniauxia marginata]